MSEGDIHDKTTSASSVIKPRVWAGETFKRFKYQLDGVMVTHIGSPSDNNRPYSVSRASYQYLKLDKYPTDAINKNSCFQNNRAHTKIHDGLGYPGLVMIDDLSMRGLLD